MYEKTEWKARQGSNLQRFEKSQETETSVVLRNEPTSVTEPGTPFSVANMNKIEQGIYDAHEALSGKVDRSFIGTGLPNVDLNNMVTCGFFYPDGEFNNGPGSVDYRSAITLLVTKAGENSDVLQTIIFENNVFIRRGSRTNGAWEWTAWTQTARDYHGSGGIYVSGNNISFLPSFCGLDPGDTDYAVGTYLLGMYDSGVYFSTPEMNTQIYPYFYTEECERDYCYLQSFFILLEAGENIGEPLSGEWRLAGRLWDDANGHNVCLVRRVS